MIHDQSSQSPSFFQFYHEDGQGKAVWKPIILFPKKSQLLIFKHLKLNNKQIFDEVKADMENYSVEPVIFDDA